MRRRLGGKSLILVKPGHFAIGDSHISYLVQNSPIPSDFKGAWEDLSMQAFNPTAFGLKNPESRSYGRKTLMNTVTNLKPDDTLVLLYGEIDARIHIPRRHLLKEVPLEQCIADTVEAYGSVLLEIKSMGKGGQIIVHGITPIKAGLMLSGSVAIELQKQIYLALNAKLKEFCEKNSFRFFDVMPLVGPSGLVESEWGKDDGIHLKPEASELFKQYLGGK